MSDASTWYVYTPGEPIKCPARLRDGSICGRAQDRVGDTSYRVRIRTPGAPLLSGSLDRICRNHECQARLEVNPCPTTTIRQSVAR